MSVPPPPEWVVSPGYYDGLDVLGLRTPVQRVGDDALNGIVTVTPAVRYLGFYCWIIRNYWQQQREARYSSFSSFVSLLESVLVLSNRLVDRGITGLLGANGASRLLNSGVDPLEPQALAQNNVAYVYGAVATELGLVHRASPTSVPQLVENRGDLLAEAVGKALASSSLGQQLADLGPPEAVTRADLQDLGSVARLDALISDERDILISAVLPNEPRDGADRRRLGTYATILHLAKELGKAPTQDDFLVFAAANTPVPEPLRSSRAAWSYFLTRDSIAVVHELALQLIVGHVEALGRHVDSSQVLDAILGSEAQQQVLKDAGLLVPDDIDLQELRCSDVWEALVNATSDAQPDGGRLAWSTPCTEDRLIHLAWDAGDGIGVLLPITWMLAVRRNSPALEAGGSRGLYAAGAGFGRLGLQDVVHPRVETWLANDALLLQAAGELLHRTVDQHLRIVWSRRASDPTRDAARIAVDGSSWRFRGMFTGGRSLNSLPQAVGWLISLDLLGQDGPTEAGERELMRILKTLGSEA